MSNHNKQIVQQLFERLSAGDLDGTLALLADDAVWTLPGKPELSPTAGTYDKARLGRLLGRMYERLEAGMQMTVLGMVAEGGRVAAEVESRGDLKNGRAYRQKYHFLFELEGGKLEAVREYLDTHHVHDVWFRPDAA
jgi:ketosteroid isomerase-like protein